MQKHLSVKITAVILIIITFISPVACARGNSDELFNKIEEMKTRAEELASKLTIENILDILSANTVSSIKQFSKNFGISTCVIIICAVFTAINIGNETSIIFNLTAKCIFIISVFPVIMVCFDKVSEHIEALCGFMLSFVPTAVALHTASGNTLSASLIANSGAGAITFLQIICTSLIIPITKAMCTLTTVNILCKKANLSGISAMMKSVSMWIIGLFFTIFTGILSLQTILQSSADNLALKGLRYSAAKMIPIAGGLVSESMKTVITAVGFIKNVTGIAGIVSVLYTVIPPLCLILAAKLYLSLLSAISKASANSDFSAYTDGLVGALNMLLALLISCSISFVILLALFMKTTVTV